MHGFNFLQDYLFGKINSFSGFPKYEDCFIWDFTVRKDLNESIRSITLK